MSKYLSDGLGLNEPRFRHALAALERRNLHPNHDLRLSSLVVQKTNQKIKELGLDPKDTTAEELYHTLNHKLADQDAKLTKKLRSLAAKRVNAEANVSDALIELARMLTKKQCFSLKPSVLRSQLKSQPPKKAMKALGYRSIDSMIKLEDPALMLLAINYFETEGYLHSFYLKYKKYSSSSFDNSKLNVLYPKDSRWTPILSEIRNRSGLSVISNYETSSLIILPIGNELKEGYLTMAVANLMSEITSIYSVSSYLKLHQVRADFGAKLSQIAYSQPYLDIKVLERNLNWQTAQKSLATIDTSSYAPHMTNQEIASENLLQRLADILPDFKFWQDNDILALIKDSEATSLNILDAASNLVNRLPFNRRRLDHFRQQLVQELMRVYIAPEQIIESLSSNGKTDDSQILADNKSKNGILV